MADGWFPEAIRDDGLNASYRRGRCLALVDVAHETVGRDSRSLIRDRGLAQFLFPKSGPPIQFAPDDAVCSHACEWNATGTGYEVERFPGEPMTPDQTKWVGAVVRWRSSRRGVPLTHHSKDAGRLPIGSSFRGVADHGGLVHRACDQHTDGWPDPEWRNAVGSAPEAPEQEDDDMGFTIKVLADDAKTLHRFFEVEGGTPVTFRTQAHHVGLAFSTPQPRKNVPMLRAEFAQVFPGVKFDPKQPVK